MRSVYRSGRNLLVVAAMLAALSGSVHVHELI
jgi:hypothetical protein